MSNTADDCYSYTGEQYFLEQTYEPWQQQWLVTENLASYQNKLLPNTIVQGSSSFWQLVPLENKSHFATCQHGRMHSIAELDTGSNGVLQLFTQISQHQQSCQNY